MNKEEQKAYSKAYYEANKEARKAYAKAYRKANPKKIKVYNKAYRKANCEKAKAKRKAWRNANPEGAKARDKACRETNKEKIKAYDRAYCKANPDKNRASVHKHRALKYQTQVEPINDKRIFIRDGWICQICRQKVDKKLKYPNPKSASLDHIIPLSKGGTHTHNNVQLAHLKCNMEKYINTLPQGEQVRLF